MNRRWLIAAALALVIVPELAAQARTSLSVIPVGGYVMPTGKWTDNGDLTLDPGGGVFVGLNAELSLNKNLSLAGEVTRTFGLTQKLEASAPNVFTGSLESDITTTTLAGLAVFRPLGRLPSGAPRTMYLEAGGGFTLYNVSRGFEDPSDPEELDFSFSTPLVMAGIGLSFPAGPRFSVQVYGRAQYELNAHESNGLDDWNQGLGTTVEGEKNLVLQLGVGLRIGR